MATTATFTFAVPPDGYCPVGNIYQGIVSYLNSHGAITVTVDSGSSGTFFYQDTTPTPTAGAIWFRKNADPFKPYYKNIYTVYNGRWVPIPLGVEIGDIRMTRFDPRGLLDTNGKGLFVPTSPAVDTPNIAGKLFGWQIPNSNNGTINLASRFPLAAYKYTDDQAWVASVRQAAPATGFADQPGGGRDGIMLTADMLPPISTRTYSATATGSTAAILSGLNYDSSVAAQPINTAGVAQLNIQPVNPLFRVIGYLEFIGYDAASE